jgi:hypothetical protein
MPGDSASPGLLLTQVEADKSGIGGTVVVCMALSDGMVLAADSRLTNIYPSGVTPQYKVISDSASKLFNVGHIGIATWDTAFILKRSTGSIIADFDKTDTGDKADVYAVAERFNTYFGKLYAQHFERFKEQPNIGFILAGYDKSGIGRFIELDYPQTAKPVPLEQTTRSGQGIVWRGQTEVIQRLIMGYDPAIGQIPEFSKLDKDTLAKLRTDLTTAAEYNIPYEALALQDGIDLSLALVQATVDMQRFSFGTRGAIGSIPGVGGNVDVMVIDPYELSWIKKKTLSTK